MRRYLYVDIVAHFDLEICNSKLQNYLLQTILLVKSFAFLNVYSKCLNDIVLCTVQDFWPNLF